jgi:hypothetical protein
VENANSKCQINGDVIIFSPLGQLFKKRQQYIASMRPQSIYIDTELLMFHFDRHDKGKSARATIAQIKTMIKNAEIKVKVPQVVLGELMLNSCDGKCDSTKIIKLLKDLNADYPNADSEIMKCANELLSDENGYMQPNDAVIVAHALKDTSTTWFLTTDTNLIGNLSIDRKMDELGHRFSISETFH